MNRLLALLPALLLPAAVLAQDVPEAARKDLWCGIAFGIIAADLPADASAENKAIGEQFAGGSETLVARAATAHIEAGYSEAAFAAYKAEQDAAVAANMSGPQADYAYSYEDCATLIGL